MSSMLPNSLHGRYIIESWDSEGNFGIPLFIITYFLRCRVHELPNIDIFDESKSATNLGLIRDIASPMARQASQGVVMIAEIFRSQGAYSEATGVNKTGETTDEGVQIEQQMSDATGASSAPSCSVCPTLPNFF